MAALSLRGKGQCPLPEVLLWALREVLKEAPMLSEIGVWLALRRDKNGLAILGAFLLLMVLAVLIWNLIP